MTRYSGILLLALICGSAGAREGEFLYQNLRIQVLGKDVVRIEERGPNGFEDRPTLNVPGRPKPMGGFVKHDGADDLVVLNSFRVRIPVHSAKLSTIRVESDNWDTGLENGKGHSYGAGRPFILADEHRTAFDKQSLDFENVAEDVYVFGCESKSDWRSNVLKLTGGLPMPPISLLGTVYQQPGSMSQASLEERVRESQVVGAPFSAVAIPRPAERRPSSEWPSFDRFRAAMEECGVAFLGAELRTEKRTQIRSFETPLGDNAAGWITDERVVLPEAVRLNAAANSNLRRAVMVRNNGSLDESLKNSIYREAGTDQRLSDALHTLLENGDRFDPFRFFCLRDDGLTDAQRIRVEQFAALVPMLLEESMTSAASLDAPTLAQVQTLRLLRERLLPLRYTLAHEAVKTGLPILRSMRSAFPDAEPECEQSQFLLGEDLLAAPVLKEGAQTVWIPPGNWMDVWTGKVNQGPLQIQVDAPISRFPLYLREGAPIALGETRAAPGAGAWKKFDLVGVLPEADGRIQRSVIEDDGKTLDFLKGEAQRTRYSLERRGNKAFFRIEQKIGDFAESVPERDWTLQLHLPVGVSVCKVRAEGVVRDVERFRVTRKGAGTLPFLNGGCAFTGGGMVEVNVPRQPGTYAFQIVFHLSQEQQEPASRN